MGAKYNCGRLFSSKLFKLQCVESKVENRKKREKILIKNLRVEVWKTKNKRKEKKKNPSDK